MASIEYHKEKIEAAIKAAFDDGFELDDCNGSPVVIELNAIVNGMFVRNGAYAEIRVPRTFDLYQ